MPMLGGYRITITRTDSDHHERPATRLGRSAGAVAAYALALLVVLSATMAGVTLAGPALGLASASNSLSHDDVLCSVDAQVDPTPGNSPDTLRLRAVHMSPLLPELDLSVENDLISSNLPYRSVDEYRSLEAGRDEYEFELETHVNGDELLDRDVALVSGSDYTLVYAAELTDAGTTRLRPVLLRDGYTLPDADEATVRFVHTSPDLPALVLRVEGTDVQTRAFGFAGTSDYVTLPAGTSRIQLQEVTADGPGDVLGVVPLTFAGGEAHTAFFTGFIDRENAPVDSPLRVVTSRDSGQATAGPPTDTAGDASDGDTDAGDGDGTTTPDEETAEPPSPARVRAVHVSPLLPGMDLLVENDRLSPNLAYKTVGGYVDLTDLRDDYEVELEVNETGDEVFEQTVAFETGADYSVVYAAEQSASGALRMRPMLLRDGVAERPADDEAVVRFVHTSPDLPPLVLNVEGPDIETRAFGFAGSSSYLTVPAGTNLIELREATASGPGRVVGLVSLTFEGGTVNTAYVTGYLDVENAPVDSPLRIVSTKDSVDAPDAPPGGSGDAPDAGDGASDDSDGDDTADPTPDAGDADSSGPARIRAVHMSPVLPGMDLLVQNARLSQDLEYRSAGAYTALDEGRTEFELEMEVNASGQEVFERDVSLEADTDYTVVYAADVSSSGALDFQPVLLRDGYTVPDADRASIRFVHVSPDMSELAVTIEGTSGVVTDGTAFREASAYRRLPPGSYTLELRDGSPDGQLLGRVPLTFEGGTVYSVFLSGYRDAPEGVEDGSLRVLAIVDAAE